MNLKVGVLMGGPSAEHEVSLATGENILRALKAKGVKAVPLKLTKDKKLYAGEREIVFPEGLKEFDVIFNGLHGTFGEDGQIQEILDGLGVAYTGSGAEASRTGMDKWLSREVFERSGLAMPRGQLVRKFGEAVQLPLPLVLKPRASGSSDGVFIIKSGEELRAKMEFLLDRGDEVVVEEYVTGREFTCGVLETESGLVALPIVEIRPAAKFEFFDYEAKYTPGATEEIVPAPIDPETSLRMQALALKAHALLGCRAYSRTDFIERNGRIYLLEINTLPGLTSASLLPKAAAAHGISFDELVEGVLKASLRRPE